jgi:ribonuclease Z
VGRGAEVGGLTVVPMTITVTTLGTGSPLPDSNRAGPSTLVTVDNTRLLVDAGRGVLMRLAGAGLLPIMLDAVLLTHLHSDHITDLNDVITTHWVMSTSPTTLHIYGPPRTAEVVDGIMAMLSPDVSYRLAHHDDLTWAPDVEVHEIAPPATFMIGAATIIARSTDHRPVEPTVGYRVEQGGASVAIAGDTVPCAGLDELCAGVNVYVQTVIRGDLVALIPNERIQDILDYHSSVEQAGLTAARGRVQTLVCTHFVPPLQPHQADEWRALAAQHYGGEIVLADDLTSISVGTDG